MQSISTQLAISLLLLSGFAVRAQDVSPGVRPVEPIPVFNFNEEGAAGFITAGPVTGQPYSLLETTTTVEALADGTTLTNSRQVRRVRDGEGRERTETGHMKDGALFVNEVVIRDPVALRVITLRTNEKMASIRNMKLPKPPNPERDARRSAEAREIEARRNARPNAPVIETLPAKNIAGIPVIGHRVTTIIPPGRQGNNAEIRVITETWASPDLKIYVQKSLDDPRNGKTTMTISDFSRADPPPALFEVPSDYRVFSPAVAPPQPN
jgi:hypothetical protein